MFGLFKKKTLHFKCPMCEISVGPKLDPTDIEGPFEFDKKYDVIAWGTCPFCKVKFDITIHRQTGKVKAFDPKWEKVKFEFDQKESALEEQVDDTSMVVEELEAILDDEDSTDSEIASAKKKLAPARKKLTTTENRLEKFQESFYTKKEKYEERQMNWQMKCDEKYG